MSERAPMPIAVIGASARLPGAASVEAFWDLLEAGRTAIGPVDPARWDHDAVFDPDQTAAGKTYSKHAAFLAGFDEFDAAFFGIEPGEARRMDPQQRLALQEAWKTFEDAGYAPDALKGRRIGVFVGARTGDYHDAVLNQAKALEPQALMGHDTAILSARISHCLDLRGPNLTVNTACSSMGVALHLAVQSLRAGEVEMALVGGVHVMSTPQRFLMHSRSRLLSRRGQCRPFDAAADGFVLGEAVGFVLLKRRADAVADGDVIQAKILATGVNHDGYCEKGITAPNPDAHAALIHDVLKQAACPPASIGYLEAHGTGTYKGDALEYGALRRVFGTGKGAGGGRRGACAIGSTKANVGHCLTAAVLPGLLRILLSFRQEKLARQAQFETPNELLRTGGMPLRVPLATAPWKTRRGRPRRAALSAFSYTGTNFHMVLEEETHRQPARKPADACLIPLSAKSETALRAQVKRIEAWLLRHRADVRLEDVARTLAIGRAHFAFRVALVAKDENEFLAALRAAGARISADAKHEKRSRGAQARADAATARLRQTRRRSSGRRAELEKLAAAYEAGAEIRWDAVVELAARTVPLPGYPFAGQRYRLDREGGTGGAGDDASARADLTLFLARRDDVFQAYLATEGKSVGGTVVLVKPGETEFRSLGPTVHQIDPRHEADFDRLVAALGPLQGRRVQVVHLWNYECEAVDYQHHGDIDRCLHECERSLDTGLRTLSQLCRALTKSAAPAALSVLFVHHGVQPHNRMAAGWLAEEWGADAAWRLTSVQLADRAMNAADVAALIAREAGWRGSARIVERPATGARPARPAVDANGTYLLDIGDDRTGLQLVEAWRRSGVGRLVVLAGRSLADAMRPADARREVWLSAELSSGDDLPRLGAALARAGVAELRGVVYLVAPGDRAHFRRNVAETLLLDEFTKDAPLGFFLLLDPSAAAAEGARFAEGFVELRSALARRGVTSVARWALPAGAGPAEADEAFASLFATAAVASAAVPATMAGDAATLERRFKRIVADVLKRDLGGIELAASLDQLDFNSMRIVDTVDRIKREFGSELRPAVFYKHRTLRGVFDEWREQLPPAPGAGEPRAIVAEQPRARHKDALAETPAAAEPIAIVGMSGRFPRARNLEEFWKNLRDGRDCIREVPADRWDWRAVRGGAAGEEAPRWGGFIDDIDKFDPGFFGISAREAELMDPQQRLFLECVWQAIEDAGHDAETLAGTATGVFVGVATSDYAEILEAAGQGRQAHGPIGLFHSMLANRASYLLDLRGPSQPVDTACSSSLVAVHRAIQAMRSGQCTQALVGGVNALLTPALFAAFREAGMLSADGRCKTFDARADGYVRGEGVGVLLLKPLSRARADGDAIHAVLRASAENHGGHAQSLTAPNPSAQAEVVASAWREAGIDPQTIGYIETHGTGTALGDPIEIEGLRQAFGTLGARNGGMAPAAHCGLGTVKTNIGHLEAAAGIAGLIKVVLAMRHATLPGNLHFTRLNPHIALEGGPFFVVEKTQAWPAFAGPDGQPLPRRAGVSSFGFGGVNAHVVLEEYPDASRPDASAPARGHPIVLSAKTDEQLRERIGQLRDFLKVQREVNTAAEVVTLRDFAYTLQVGRTAMAERFGFVADSLAALDSALGEFLAGRLVAGVRRGRAESGSGLVARFADDAGLRAAARAWAKEGNWPALLDFWMEGGRVDWRECWTGGRPARVHLPGYPFARERYWAGGGATPVAGRVDDVASRRIDGERRFGFLEKHWQPREPVTAGAVTGTVVILADRATAALAEALRARMPDSVVLDDGADELGPELLPPGCAGWIDVTGCGTGRSGGLGWVPLLQRIVDQARDGPRRILGVTKGLERLANETVNSRGATRAALYRMLQGEYAAVRSCHVDGDPRADDAALAAQIAAEFFAAGDEAEVCYRNGQRHGAVLREAPFAPEDAAAVAFPQDHVLWVTGGTRGLGQLCAAHLVRRAGVRKLVLTGRAALPPREEWSARAAADDAVAERIRAVQELEAAGVTVRVLAVDLTDADAVRRERDAIKRELGPIGGVLHCAGLVDEENPAFVRKPLAAIRAVLAPKVAATDVLLECFRDEPLAFFVLFSSVSAIVPRLAAGLADYAMANAHLDQSAEVQAGVRPVISVRWPSWKETGMGEVRSAAYAESGLLGLTDAEGLRFLDHILRSRRGPVVTPVVYDPARWAPGKLLDRRARASAAETKAPRAAVRAWLSDIFARELKLDPAKLRPEVPLQDYGMDSILLAQAWKRINRELGVELDPSAVFEHPSVARLADWLERTQPDALAAIGVARSEPPAVEATTPTRRTDVAPTSARNTDIAVVGLACRFAGAGDLDAYARLLADGRSAIARVPDERWPNPDGFVAGLLANATDFDPDYFLLSEEDARAMDPQALLVLEESLKLFHHAGYAPAEIKGAAIGVYLGARTQHAPDMARLGAARNPILAVGQNYLAANVSRFFDLRGPSLVVDTACSSALTAMSLALPALRSGEIEAAAVGGVSLLASDATHRLFRQRKLLSPDATFHVFDQRAAGVVLGEGAGMVLLKTVERAEADGDRIYAVLRGLAVNNDGRTAGPAAPSAEAQRAVMAAALARTGLRPEEIGYIEANGSGSEVTDLLELKAIAGIYGGARRRPCALGSVKPNIGHPLCAEGIAGFVKLVLMLDRGRIFPFASGRVPLTHFDLAASPFAFRREDDRWDETPRRAALNCFADGGTNAHVILESREISPDRPARRRPLALPVLRRRNLHAAARDPWTMPIDAAHPLVRNHRAHGQALLPGLAYLDLLHQFFVKQGVPLAEQELTNLSIHRPLAIGPGRKVTLEIQSDAVPGDGWRLRVEDGAGVPGEAMLLVTAEMRRRPAAGFGSTSDRATPGATSEAMPLEDAYAHFRAKGLEHTGAMKAEGTIRVTDTGRWIEVTLPPEARADAAAYLLHPTLLDGAAVGAGPLFDAMLGGEDRLFLPLFFGRFRAREALRERCEARVRTATLRRKNELLYSDLEFFNAAGEQVAELTDFVYKLVRRSDAVQLAAPGAGAESRKETAATACAGEERIAVSAGDAPGDVAARLVQSVIGAKLKRPAEAVELDAGYYELGLDSAMLLDVVAVLGRKLAAALSPTLLFEFATPRELAAQLAATHPAEIARLAMAPAAEEVPAARFVVAAFPLRAASAPQRDRKAAEVLVAGLLERRMALWVEDGAVKARAEEARLTPEVRAEIAANAAAIAEIAGARRLLPMTRSQRRYWVLSTLQPERSAYNNPIGMRLRGEVDVTRLKEAVTILVNSHHVLRAEFPRLGRGPVMALAPAVKEFPCQLIRLPATDAAARERALQELAARESAEPINPGVGPNLRVTLVALAADDVAVLLTAHHAVFDGYSYLPVMSELMRIYRALERGQRPDTDGIVQYEDYALREPAPGSEAAARFWREHLAGAPGGTVLPFDRERAPVNAGRGDVRSIRIGEAAYRSIHATLQERQVSLFAFMLSILKAAIAGWAQQGDLVFGTTVQCRDEDNDKDVIGDFTNFIPIRSRIDAEEPFAALLQRVHRTSLLCLQHKAFPFDAIVALAGPAPRSGNPVYNILVNQLPSITAMEERISDDRRRVTVSNNRLLNRSAMLDLRFEWYEEEGGLRLIGEYNTDLFRDETIERLLQRIEACLNERVYAGAVKVADLMPRRTPAPAVQEKAASAPATVAETRAAGANEVEALIVEKIRGLKEVPGIERMKEVNFFELGLGSFDIANLSVELEPRHPELVVGDFFKYPTIRALAAHLAAIGSNAESQTSGSEIADVGRHGGRPSDEAEAVRDGDGAIDFELLFRT